MDAREVEAKEALLGLVRAAEECMAVYGQQDFDWDRLIGLSDALTRLRTACPGLVEDALQDRARSSTG